MITSRKLSVHQEHELLLKLEAAGLDGATAQKIIESRGNRLAKEMLSLVGTAHILSLTEAKEIMGAGNFFGPNEWNTKFGKKFQLTQVPEIPWTANQLRDPGLKQPHFLFLGIDELGGKPLNIVAWQKLYSGKNHPKFYWDLYLTHGFAQTTCQLRWYLMPVGIVEGSLDLSYDCQEALLPDEYEVPTATARVTGNILYYLLNGKYLDTGCWSRVSDESDSGRRVSVQGNSDNGINVNNWNDNRNDNVGLGASRKLL